MFNEIKKYPDYLKWIIITNICYYGLLIPAALIDPGYSPITNTVSSLGNTAKNPVWFFFSLSLIFMAYALLPFFWDLRRLYTNQPEVKKYIIPIIAIGFFNSFALIMIAINPTNIFSSSHNFWSLVNFICIELVIILAVIGLRNHPAYNNKISLIALFDFVFCFVYLQLLHHVDWAPTLEWLTFIFILSYLLILSLQMHKANL